MGGGTDGIESIELSDVDDVELWLIGLLFFGVGDLVTTGVGVGIGGITEANPLVASMVLDGGIIAMGTVKLLTLAAFLFLWRLLPGPERVGIPLALSVVGISVTLWNLHVLALATGSSFSLV